MDSGSRHPSASPAPPASRPDGAETADAAARRRTMLTGVLAVLFFITMLALVGWLVTSRMQSDYRQQQAAQQANQTAARYSGEQRSSALDAARVYNRTLFENGQAELGAIRDPATAIRLQKASQGLSNGSDAGDGRTDADLIAADQGALSDEDPDYNNLLNIGGGIMGTLSIPSIDATMPIYHGTSNAVLSSGAGHLYGTSLPVGGADTHAVLTAHRGLVTAELFTRLDEMQVGDVFSIAVLGNTLNYKVDRISVVEPDDVSQLTVTPGEDRVTLLTCTPYGVNTHRLLVSALRTSDSAPVEAAAISPVRMRNAWQWASLTAVVIAALGVMYLALSRLPAVPISRHRSGERRFA